MRQLASLPKETALSSVRWGWLQLWGVQGHRLRLTHTWMEQLQQGLRARPKGEQVGEGWIGSLGLQMQILYTG